MTTYTNCVTPQGKFIYGIHKPSYSVANLRSGKELKILGLLEDGSKHVNIANFPDSDVRVKEGGWIFEIPNPLPFRGATYIDKRWADTSAADHSKIKLAQREPLSFREFLKDNNIDSSLISSLPRPLLLSLATCSTDPYDLEKLAHLCCEFVQNSSGKETGLRYVKSPSGSIRAVIRDHDLFEAVANNPSLGNDYKKAMVLRPGAQGESEITAEWKESENSHIFEYLRKNSYIAGGHFAANMADDAVRYSIASLSEEDMHGLRHLYYQRMYIQIANLVGIKISNRSHMSAEDLEQLRLQLLEALGKDQSAHYATLWGWNFGFDYSPTDYRLHASHQQIHQQYAVIPELVNGFAGDIHTSVGNINAFSCGDMVTRSIEDYRHHYQSDLFKDYIRAINQNVRMDNRADLPSSLIVWQDDKVMIFIPKAQTSQWELQIMTKPNQRGEFPGNIFETDDNYRKSLNLALLKAQQVLASLGARMVTSIEYSKRLGISTAMHQPLLYSLLPKLPYSMGAFSEAQMRFINGHYPEDFAVACRNQLDKLAADNKEH
jgi:hypothetical protein